MPRSLFIYFFVFLPGLVPAQTAQQLIDQRTKTVNPGSANSIQDYNKEVKDRVPSQNQLLIDKNKDPQLPGSLKYSSALNLSSLLNSYPVVGFSPVNTFGSTPFHLPVASTRIIDARFDVGKISFLPIGNEMQKKGYTCVGLQINKNLSNWLSEAFIEKALATDSTSNRQLIIVIRKFWFSNSTTQLYSVANPPLLTTLDYQFDVFTSKDIGYFPQKKIAGSFTSLYNKGNSYSVLTDSLLAALKEELLNQDLAVKETESNWQSPVDFNDYYNSRIRKTNHFEKMSPGMYASYADFLANNRMSDSVEISARYTNYDRAPLYACQLTAFKEGQHIFTNRSWGYFDGSSIFLNTGNGFFIRLIRSKDDYVFFHLKNIREDRIKKDVLEGIQIGSSPYQVLKDYTKAFMLTYQLDMETGKLY
jgi:hypothetical protein